MSSIQIVFTFCIFIVLQAYHQYNACVIDNLGYVANKKKKKIKNFTTMTPLYISYVEKENFSLFLSGYFGRFNN